MREYSLEELSVILNKLEVTTNELDVEDEDGYTGAFEEIVKVEDVDEEESEEIISQIKINFRDIANKHGISCWRSVLEILDLIDALGEIYDERAGEDGWKTDEDMDGVWVINETTNEVIAFEGNGSIYNHAKDYNIVLKRVAERDGQ